VRALVTGGAGFIGSTLVDALLARGDEVAVLDDLIAGRREQVAAPLHEADVGDERAVTAVLEAVRPEVVFHLAAQIDVRRAVTDPAFDARVNVGGTAAVLEAARSAGARRLVLASTGGAIYGDAAVVPTAEDAPAVPLSPYGASKAAAEAYLALYRRLHGLSTLALRLANVYGPRQDPRGEAGVVARYCDAVLDGRPATVFGDGRQTRDYLYVEDAVAAFLLAGDDDAEGVLNVGTGTETSVLELAHHLGLEPRHEPARPGEVHRSALDARAAGAALGWRARTPLADGLERTLSWVGAARTG